MSAQVTVTFSSSSLPAQFSVHTAMVYFSVFFSSRKNECFCLLLLFISVFNCSLARCSEEFHMADHQRKNCGSNLQGMTRVIQVMQPWQPKHTMCILLWLSIRRKHFQQIAWAHRAQHKTCLHITYILSIASCACQSVSQYVCVCVYKHE